MTVEKTPANRSQTTTPDTPLRQAALLVLMENAGCAHDRNISFECGKCNQKLVAFAEQHADKTARDCIDRMSEARAERQRLEAEVARLTADLLEREQMRSDLQHEVSRLRVRLRCGGSSVSAKEGSGGANTSDDSLAALQAEVARLRADRERLQAAFESKEAWDGVKEITQLKAENARLTAEDNRLRAIEASGAHRVQPIPANPIQLTTEQELEVKQWSADDRLWTTQETVEFNLRTFARVVLKDVVLRVNEAEAEVARLTAERDSFYMNYRMKCDVQTKEQAVEIERLTADLDQLRTEREYRNKLLADAEAENARLTAERDALRLTIEAGADKVAELVAERERLTAERAVLAGLVYGQCEPGDHAPLSVQLENAKAENERLTAALAQAQKREFDLMLKVAVSLQGRELSDAEIQTLAKSFAEMKE